MGFQAVRGTTDLLPDEVARWTAVEHTVRRMARLYGYRELRTPIMEDEALFLRSIGETTDIVQKEMFRVADRGGHGIVLRPEGTAPIVRAYLERHLDKTQGFAKLFYLGPMFRAERPQAGRFRQFHQYGVEAIGSASPWVDIEVITLCMQVLHACGLTKTELWLASMGCRQDQQRSAEQLRERLRPHLHQLCKDCQARVEKNVFRVLDCKNPTCLKIVWDVYEPYRLCGDCSEHFVTVRQGLKEVGISYDDTKTFARGLDYYTRTVFEVRAKGLGAQDAVAAGGRYDHLVEELGGPAVGAVGCAAGIERLLMAVEAHRTPPAPSSRRGLYLAVAHPTLLREGFRFVQQLRERGVGAVMDYDGKSLKAQLREADKHHCRVVAILGEAELKAQAMTLKDLEQGTQRSVPFDALVDEVSQQMNPSCH